MGCGGIQPRETDFIGRALWGRGLRDRHPSTTRPTARSLPLGARATGRQGGASPPSRSHSPRTSSARLVDRTATGATRPWRRQRATASRPLAGPRPARTLTHAPRDTSPCTSDGPLISCRDRAPAAVTVAREPTAASSQPKGCAPTPLRPSERRRHRGLRLHYTAAHPFQASRRQERYTESSAFRRSVPLARRLLQVAFGPRKHQSAPCRSTSHYS